MSSTWTSSSFIFSFCFDITFGWNMTSSTWISSSVISFCPDSVLAWNMILASLSLWCHQPVLPVLRSSNSELPPPPSTRSLETDMTSLWLWCYRAQTSAVPISSFEGRLNLTMTSLYHLKHDVIPPPGHFDGYDKRTPSCTVSAINDIYPH